MKTLRKSRWPLLFASVAGLGLLSSAVLAHAQSLTQPEPDAVSIYNGDAVDRCGWPSAVSVIGAAWKDDNRGYLLKCSGVLIHPQVVAFAAHCLNDHQERRSDVIFTEDQNFYLDETGTPQDMYVVGSDCYKNPRWPDGPFRPTVQDRGNDYAFCVLDEPVDIPFSPVAYGCESDEVQIGTRASMVGYGANAGTEGGWHLKRWGEAVLSEVTSRHVEFPSASGSDSGPCAGDSGGPAFLRMSDGSYRPFAVVSGGAGPSCGTQTFYARIDRSDILGWIESTSGIDVTPCHDINGNWDPTPLCGNFSTAGPAGTGNWADRCEGSAVSDMSSTCGAAFDRSLDAGAPAVTVSAPSDGATFPSGGFDGIVTAAATDPDGYPVRRGWLEVDGVALMPRIAGDAFDFEDVALGDGTHTIAVVAEDWSGNVGRSAELTVVVGEASATSAGPGSGEDGASGVATEGDDGLGTDSGATQGGTQATGPTQEGDTGCACTGAAPSPLWSLLLLTYPLRRRRSH